MPHFDSTKAYAPQEEVFFDDGREIELLHYIYNRSDLDQLRGNPSKILQAIDEYGRSRRYLMNVGEDKGKIVAELIAEVKPKTMVTKKSIPLRRHCTDDFVIRVGRARRLHRLLHAPLRRGTPRRGRKAVPFPRTQPGVRRRDRFPRAARRPL